MVYVHMVYVHKVHVHMVHVHVVYVHMVHVHMEYVHTVYVHTVYVHTENHAHSITSQTHAHTHTFLASAGSSDMFLPLLDSKDAEAEGVTVRGRFSCRPHPVPSGLSSRPASP